MIFALKTHFSWSNTRNSNTLGIDVSTLAWNFQVNVWNLGPFLYIGQTPLTLNSAGKPRNPYVNKQFITVIKGCVITDIIGLNKLFDMY